MTRYLENLNECTDPASGDFLHIYDASAGSTDKDRKVNLNKLALLAAAQTFTNAQTIAPTATNVVGLTIANPANASNYPLRITENGIEAWIFRARSGDHGLTAPSFNNSNSIGPYIYIGRNNNASTPAAGVVYIIDKGNTPYAFWPDDSGNLRIYSGDPTNANDTAGTVVGTQSSSLDSKNIAGDPIGVNDVLIAIQAAAAAVRRFTYKSGAYGGEEFSGLITDFVPRYGMDRDAEHPAGKSLNIVNAIGDLMIAVNHLAQRIAAMEQAQQK